MTWATAYKGSNSNRLLSPNIWADCPRQQLMEGSIDGVTLLPGSVFDDFQAMPTTPTITTTIGWGPYQVFGSSGATITEGDEIGGTLLFTEVTENEGIVLATRMFPFQISTSHGDLWFEARLKWSAVADNGLGTFIGLIDSATISATVPIAAAGTLADENFVGFHRLEGDGDAADFVYKANGVTQVTVKADAATLAADTYVKLGFRWKKSTGKLYHYVNGVESPTTYTMATADGTDFPNDVRLGVIYAQLMGSGAAGVAELDWWACAQVAAT